MVVSDSPKSLAMQPVDPYPYLVLVRHVYALQTPFAIAFAEN